MLETMVNFMIIVDGSTHLSILDRGVDTLKTKDKDGHSDNRSKPFTNVYKPFANGYKRSHMDR